ncbi:hypothetical protein Aperf_G00000021606 [Anoplocephala perfoliata]
MGMMKVKKKSSVNVLEQRRKQLIEDNMEEERNIKKLSKKLGLNRRKPKKDGTEKLPTWMRDSGLDYLFNIKKYDKVSAENSNIVKIVGEKNKAKKPLNIYGQDSVEIEDNSEEGEEMNVDSEDEKGLDTIYEGEEDDGVSEENEIVEEIKFNDDEEVDEPQTASHKEDKPNETDADATRTHNGDFPMLQRNIRRLLNCVSETQMAKVTGELVNLFSDRPRAAVRQILIDEIDILLASFPLSRGQSVGWLQQELAACFVSTEARLHHAGEDSRLVAHFVEFFVSSKLPPSIANLSESDGGSLASRCLFVAYLYRFGALTGDLIVDFLDEFLKHDDLLALQIANQILKPISSVLRKEMHERCSKLMNSAKEIIAALDPTEFEKCAELEGILANLSSKRSKEPALLSADYFVKMIRNWNKGISFPRELRLPLRLEELRNAKKAGRWWAVGSAFSGDNLKPSDPVSAGQSISSKKAITLSPELQAVAQQLGLITSMRQQLFAVLVSTPGGPESTATALIAATGGGGSNSRTASEHREREAVQIVMHCLISEQPFNRFYARVLGALLNHHRRFMMMVRCSFWDVMGKEELTKEAKGNAGKAIGILASVYDFPLTLLKKFDFGDESEANTGLLSALVTELTSASFKKTLEKFAYVASNSPKLGRNLRIFMRRLSKTHPDEACRAYLARLVSELRDLFP